MGPNARGLEKCDFRKVTRYISKTVQDRCIVSMEGESSLFLRFGSSFIYLERVKLGT